MAELRIDKEYETKAKPQAKPGESFLVVGEAEGALALAWTQPGGWLVSGARG